MGPSGRQGGPAPGSPFRPRTRPRIRCLQRDAPEALGANRQGEHPVTGTPTTATDAAPGGGGTDERLSLDISGMSCAACAHRIEHKLNKLDRSEEHTSELQSRFDLV